VRVRLAILLDAGLVDPHARDPRPTCTPNGRAKRIDYILCTRELRAEAIATEALDDATPLPSLAMPSDHVPIAAVLTRAV